MSYSFENVKVLVIGDVMLDRYWWGTVNRISPEAPVPVVSLDDTTMACGGAGNVGANIAGLGAEAWLVGITGDDAEAALLPPAISSAGIARHHLIPIRGRRTTLKNRIVAHNQQMIRLDQETSTEITSAEAEPIAELVCRLIEEAHIVVLSDYAKGFLTPAFTENVIAHAVSKGKTVLVDPKGSDYSKYRGATILTPNQREAADACGLDPGSENVADLSAERLVRELELEALLITQGEMGMTLYERGVDPVSLKASARKVYNVTGAGDTAIATMAVALGSGLTFLESAQLANTTAGLVIENVGTTAITLDMLHSRDGAGYTQVGR